MLRAEVEARITVRTVEIFHRGKLVAAQIRSLRPHRPTTLAEHMPSSHRRYRDWTHGRILRKAAAIGDDTAALIEVILRSRPHPEQGFRSCIGILGLSKRYGAERLDGAWPVARWHEIIGDPTFGDAILDRVIHRAHRIELRGDSLRKRSAITTTESLTNTKEK